MNEATPTSEPGQEGVVLQLARDDVERKRFLKMAGKTIGSGAAATGLAAFIAACGSSSSSSSSSASSAGSSASSSSTATTGMASGSASGSGDLAIVNYALTLEYLESEFHASTLSTLKTFGQEEQEHVSALESVAKSLGTPAAKPMGKFPLTNASAVAHLAATGENSGEAASLGQAPHITSKQILAAALSIHSIEARHAATLNTLLKMSPTPEGAFAKPMTMAQVL